MFIIPRCLREWHTQYVRNLRSISSISPHTISISMWPYASPPATPRSCSSSGVQFEKLPQRQSHVMRIRLEQIYDDVIKWKHFPRYWPFVWGIHRSPVNSPHKGQWRGAFMFSLISASINGGVNNREAGNLRRFRNDYDVIIMRGG